MAYSQETRPDRVTDPKVVARIDRPLVPNTRPVQITP
jgi:hypothetical protein